jgi:hypothetical protein
VEYEYAAEGRVRFGLSLGLLVDCLNTFSSPGHASTVQIRYPGPDMQLLLKYGYPHGCRAIFRADPQHPGLLLNLITFRP